MRVEGQKVTSKGVDIPVTLWFSNDEDLEALVIPLHWTGEAYLDLTKNSTDPLSEYYIFRDFNGTPNRLKPYCEEGGWGPALYIDSLSNAAFLPLWGLPPVSPGSGLLATINFTCNQPSAPEIDTCLYPPAHELLFIQPDNNYFVPQFLGWDPMDCNSSFSDPCLLACPL